MTDFIPAIDRQRWLDKGQAALVRKFHDDAGHSLPDTVRFGYGFTSSRRHIGECWHSQASSDGAHEIFLCARSLGMPKTESDKTRLKVSCRVLDVMAHELAHVVAGPNVGHKAAFKHIAYSVGLTGAATATVATPEFNDWASGIIEKLGPFPGAKISDIKIKKQTTRLLKTECVSCGYAARVTAKWLDDEAFGPPICPGCMEPMIVDD